MVNQAILTYKTKKAVSKYRDIRKSIPFAQAVQIGLLFTVEDRSKHDAIKRFIHDLEKEGKKVTTVCFLPKGRDNHEFLFDFYEKKEISFTGKIANPKVEQFIDKSFDFLFLLDRDISAFHRYLLAVSRAKCRVGPYVEGAENFLEFMLKPSVNSLNEDLNQYLTYIKRIK